MAYLLIKYNHLSLFSLPIVHILHHSGQILDLVVVDFRLNAIILSAYHLINLSVIQLTYVLP